MGKAFIYGLIFRSGSLNFRVSRDKEAKTERSGRKGGRDSRCCVPEGIKVVVLQLLFIV